MNKENSLPFYVKTTQILLGLIAFTYVLFIAQQIILPILFSLIIAILLDPCVKFLIKKGLNKPLAICLVILAAAILLFILAFFISSQFTEFSDIFPKFKQKSSELFSQLINWISQTFGLNKSKITDWISKAQQKTLKNTDSLIGPAFGTITGLFMLLILMPVYIFLILLYKPLFLKFIEKLVPEKEHSQVNKILSKSKYLIQSYLIGLMIETGIVALLNSLGLLVLGVESAILIGVIGAILNLIPYIGGVIAIALAMIMAITSQSPIYALWVFILYNVIQILDNHFIIPKIVASKVNINALVSIICVLIGGTLWGIPGMFLAVPLTAIIKVIFDDIEKLKPIGYLLGNDIPEN